MVAPPPLTVNPYSSLSPFVQLWCTVVLAPISTLVAYDHAALMDQEDKYRHGVDCFMVVDQKKLNKKKREEEKDAGSE